MWWRHVWSEQCPLSQSCQGLALECQNLDTGCTRVPGFPKKASLWSRKGLNLLAQIQFSPCYPGWDYRDWRCVFCTNHNQRISRFRWEMLWKLLCVVIYCQFSIPKKVIQVWKDMRLSKIMAVFSILNEQTLCIVILSALLLLKDIAAFIIYSQHYGWLKWSLKWSWHGGKNCFFKTSSNRDRIHLPFFLMHIIKLYFLNTARWKWHPKI